MSERLHNNQIDTLIEGNRKNFQKWIDENNAFQTLAISQDQADIFVPRRLLELSDNPENVHVLITESGDSNLGFWVYEHLDHTITDPRVFEKYNESQKEKKVRVIPEFSKAPPDIDFMHLHTRNLLADGTIGFNDKVYIGYYADKEPNYSNVTFTRSYFDRPDMQRMGIGTSFYGQLEGVLKELQFKYLAGMIISRHPQFFEKTRTLFEDLPQEIRDVLPQTFYKTTEDHPPVYLKIL